MSVVIADLSAHQPHLRSSPLLDCDNPLNDHCATGDLTGANFDEHGIMITLDRRPAPLAIPWAAFHPLKAPPPGTMD